MGETLPRDDNNQIMSNVYKSLVASRKVVTTAGTRVQLSDTSVACKRLDIMAETDNTGNIAIGNVAVVALAGSEEGIILNAGQTYTFYVTNLNLIYLDSTVSGDGVTFVYFD